MASQTVTPGTLKPTVLRSSSMDNATPAMQPAMEAFQALLPRLPVGTSYIYEVHTASLMVWVPDADGHRRLHGLVRFGRTSGRIRGVWARGTNAWVVQFLAIVKAAGQQIPAGFEQQTEKHLAAVPKGGAPRVALGDYAKVGQEPEAVTIQAAKPLWKKAIQAAAQARRPQ